MDFLEIYMILFILMIMLSKFYAHLLMILLCLEFLVLGILYSLYYELSLNYSEIYFLVIMVFFVIESVLGLSILVCLIHFKGSDKMKNLNLMMW